MTGLPPVSRQATRQIILPPFAAKEEKISAVAEWANIPLELEGGNLIKGGERPPVGYALEIYSLYHPLLVSLKLSAASEEISKEIAYTVVPSMQLLRRGVVLWQGSASLIPLRETSANLATTFFVGEFAAQFQTPIIVPSPSELELRTVLLATGFRTVKLEAAAITVNVFSMSSLETGPFAEYVRAGAINFTLGEETT